MLNNPFCEPGVRRPLGQEVCQHIHYDAVIRAARGEVVVDIPPTLDLVTLRTRAPLLGREVYLEHPDTITTLFASISLSVYRTVRSLYCSRLERSPLMVWHILRAMANTVHAEVPPYEAVWAVCMYQDEQRKRETMVTVKQVTTTWWVTQMSYEDAGQHNTSDESKPMVLVCVCDLVHQVILAFRLTNQQQVSEIYAEVLYDALSRCRRPSPESTAGLVWSFPQSIVIEQPLSMECERGCVRLGISLKGGHERPEFLQTLLVNWSGEATRRSVKTEMWETLFDSYVYRVTGSSPWHSKEEGEYLYRNRLGYMRDPAWQCPALRHFLPLHAASISRDGVICVDGTQYADDLLTYWSEASVMIRQSERRAESLWVYLDGSLLCQAMAREHQRDNERVKSPREER